MAITPCIDFLVFKFFYFDAYSVSARILPLLLKKICPFRLNIFLLSICFVFRKGKSLVWLFQTVVKLNGVVIVNAVCCFVFLCFEHSRFTFVYFLTLQVENNLLLVIFVLHNFIVHLLTMK